MKLMGWRAVCPKRETAALTRDFGSGAREFNFRYRLTHPQIISMFLFCSIPVMRGVSSVTNVGMECGGRGRVARRAMAASDAEVVWFWHPWAGAKPAGRLAGDGD